SSRRHDGRRDLGRRVRLRRGAASRSRPRARDARRDRGGAGAARRRRAAGPRVPRARRRDRAVPPLGIAPRLPHVSRAGLRQLQPLLLPAAPRVPLGRAPRRASRRRARARPPRPPRERRMKAAVCPGCGAEIAFKDPGAIVRVCEYCNSVVARGDLTYENLGKSGDAADSRSPLATGLDGAYQGQGFTLTGRVLLRHPAGGTWEEWYAHFADGRWGWLAEAQGKFYLTFEV